MAWTKYPRGIRLIIMTIGVLCSYYVLKSLPNYTRITQATNSFNSKPGEAYDTINDIRIRTYSLNTNQQLQESNHNDHINITATVDNKTGLETIEKVLQSPGAQEPKSWGEIRARQSSLLQTKSEQCRSAGPWPPLDPRRIQTLMVDSLHKAAFCAVAKVASTSWTSTLLKLVGREDQVAKTPHETFIKSNQSALTYINNFTPGQSQRILRDFYMFMFVREPWERLLSAYYYTVGSSRRNQFYSQQGPEFLKQFSESEAKERISFSEFLRFIGSSTDGLANANLHWRPIYLWCHVCQVNYTFIGKLENLDDEARYVLFHGFHQPLKEPIMPKNNTNKYASARETLRVAYKDVPTSITDRIVELYKLDFELFEYAMEPPK